jgi:hypothetical protein
MPLAEGLRQTEKDHCLWYSATLQDKTNDRSWDNGCHRHNEKN